MNDEIFIYHRMICYVCRKSCKNKESLKNHRCRAKSVEESDYVNMDNPDEKVNAERDSKVSGYIQCQICDGLFPGAQLYNHIYEFHRKSNCSLCRLDKTVRKLQSFRFV